MPDITVAQLDAERFDVIIGLHADGRRLRVVMPRHVRHGLGLASVAPSAVVAATVEFVLERQPVDLLADEVQLAALAGAYPEWPEEVRARLTT